MRRSRHTVLVSLAVLLGAVYLWTDLVEARRRRRRRGSKYRYKIKAGEATHALIPLRALGLSERKTRELTDKLQSAVGKVPGVKVASLKNIRKFLKGRYGAPFANCQFGDLDCQSDFGSEIKAPLVLAGGASELAGRIHLSVQLIDPAKKVVVRSISVAPKDNSSAVEAALREASYRLLAPDKYRGKLALNIDTRGAAIYIDGKRYSDETMRKPLEIQAGVHALRVTHPQYHDYIRWVTVKFDKETKVDIQLKQYPIIKDRMKYRKRARPRPRAGRVAGPEDKVLYRPLPWYKKWWFITSVAAVTLATTILVVVLAKPPRLERDASITLRPPTVGATLLRFR